jgi:hypothetical protein
MVEAHRNGTYPNRGELNAWYRKPGDQFFIKDRKSFSESWMTIVGSGAKPVPSNIQGHGATVVNAENTPMTTIKNQVSNPLQVMNDLARVNQQEQRGR